MQNQDWTKKIDKIIIKTEYHKRDIFFDLGKRKKIYLMFGETTNNKDSLRELANKKSPNEFYLPEFFHSETLNKSNFDLLRQEEVMLAISANTTIDIVNLSYGSISEMGSMIFAPTSRNKILVGYSYSTLKKNTYIDKGPLKLLDLKANSNKKELPLNDWNIELQSHPNWTHRLIYKPDPKSVQNYMDWIKSHSTTTSKQIKKIWKINKAKLGNTISMPGAMFWIYEYIAHQKNIKAYTFLKNFLNIIKDSKINSIAYVNFYHTTYDMSNNEERDTRNLIKFLIILMIKLKILKYNSLNKEITLGPRSSTFYKNPLISLRLSNFNPVFISKKTDLVTFLDKTFQLKFLELINFKEGKKSTNYFEWSQKNHSNNKYWNRNKTKNKKIWTISLAHKNVQKAINHYFWNHTNLSKNISKNSFAYQKEKNVVQYAKLHINKKSIIKLDILSFFPTIHYAMIENTLRTSYNFNDDEIKLIKTVCLKNETLPIGWSTSPVLSELVFAQIDNKINSAMPKDAVWSRYADDITISFESEKTLSYLVHINKGVEQILSNYGFNMNKEKTGYYIIKQNNKTKEDEIYFYDKDKNESNVDTVKITGLIIQSIYKRELGFPRCSNRKYKKLTKLYYAAGREDQKFIGLSQWLKYVNNKQYKEWKNMIIKK